MTQKKPLPIDEYNGRLVVLSLVSLALGVTCVGQAWDVIANLFHKPEKLIILGLGAYFFKLTKTALGSLTFVDVGGKDES